MAKTAAGQLKESREIGKIALVALFLLAIYLPGLQQAFHLVPIHALTEKRTLAAPPAFSPASWFSESFMRDYNRYFDDHSGFREVMIRLHNGFYTSVLHVVPNPHVILGKQGWLFYSDAGDDYKREYTPKTAVEAEGFCRGMAALGKQLGERGVRLVFIVVPNKSTMYPEYMPDNYLRQLGPNLAERVTERLNELGVPSRFLKEALQKHRSETVLYEPKGTHWNPLGAYYGTAEVLRVLDKMYGVKRNLPEKVGHYFSSNHSNQDVLMLVESVKGTKGICAQPGCEMAAGDRKLPPVLWYGDSFCIIPTPYLEKQFASFTYEHIIRNPMTETLAANLPGKKLVVFMVAERNVRSYLIKHPVAVLGGEAGGPGVRGPALRGGEGSRRRGGGGQRG
jgi:hypothetical protein